MLDLISPANFAANLSNIEGVLNEHSYNQSFTKWDIGTEAITYNTIKNNISLLRQDSILKARCKNMTNTGLLFASATQLILRAGITYTADTYVGIIVNDSIISPTMTFDGLGLDFGKNFFIMANDVLLKWLKENINTYEINKEKLFISFE
jgi:hypothetical protein